MVNFLMEYKWLILIISESTTWITTFYMLYARYWLNSNIQFYIFSGISFVTGYFPHILIGIIDFIKYKKLDGFTLIIILLFIFAFTFGKKVVLKIDSSLQKSVNRRKGTY